MKISIIVATDLEGGIGYENKLPWHLPEDLKFFKKTTLNNPILMGRKTLESIGKVLPNRLNLVLSGGNEIQFKYPDAIILPSIDALYGYCKTNSINQLFIIGGASIYNFFLPFADEIYLTKVHNTFKTDVKLNLDLEKWHCLTKQHFIADTKHQHNFDISHYIKK